jgi:Domain of unknown function (DUF4145)
VTGDYARDFREASLVLDLSPKASAALSRRLPQRIIRQKAGVTRRTLNDEIDAVNGEGRLGSNLAEDLDMIRAVGNFAAHPTKNINTGELFDIELGEAKGLLDVVEELLDLLRAAGAPRGSARRAQREARPRGEASTQGVS